MIGGFAGNDQIESSPKEESVSPTILSKSEGKVRADEQKNH